MISPFSRGAGIFQTVSPFYVSNEVRDLDIKLFVGSGGDLRDDRRIKFNRRLEFRFQGDRIWIPCFIRIGKYIVLFKGLEHIAEYIGAYSIPRDMSEITFAQQFKFNRKPSDQEINQFWSDVSQAIGLFLLHNRSYYEESVTNPAPPRFIMFESGLSVRQVDWTKMDWGKISASAMAAMNAARGA